MDINAILASFLGVGSSRRDKEERVVYFIYNNPSLGKRAKKNPFRIIAVIAH